ncbi:hypothetical protein GCM10022240_11770 [Microbacterium kribbense]|uniref:Sugar ABC transporter ATPase n=1 Tax=Microbacterium kribbense TaxID=433645 RepID=A0ABP7GBC3_9MICO
MSDARDPRGQGDVAEQDPAPALFHDPPPDQERTDLQDADLLTADLGPDGQGDLAPEDDVDSEDLGADDGPDGLRIADEP